MPAPPKQACHCPRNTQHPRWGLGKLNPALRAQERPADAIAALRAPEAALGGAYRPAPGAPTAERRSPRRDAQS